MVQSENVKRLGKNEFYKCPLPHVQSKHEQALFRDFESHFRIFSDRDDHLEVIQLHEDLVWNKRREACEKGKLGEEDLQRISFEAWFQAVKQCTGKPVQIVVKK
ncbi:MAG: hypothetical protein QXU99_07585 [Candidatus Bathyarchaeia archaeon]